MKVDYLIGFLEEIKLFIGMYYSYCWMDLNESDFGFIKIYLILCFPKEHSLDIDQFIL